MTLSYSEQPQIHTTDSFRRGILRKAEGVFLLLGMAGSIPVGMAVAVTAVTLSGGNALIIPAMTVGVAAIKAAEFVTVLVAPMSDKKADKTNLWRIAACSPIPGAQFLARTVDYFRGTGHYYNRYKAKNLHLS